MCPGVGLGLGLVLGLSLGIGLSLGLNSLISKESNNNGSRSQR